MSRLICFSTLVVVALSLILSGCSADEDTNENSVVEDTCQRADECNALEGSVNECVDSTSTSLKQMSETERAEITFEIQMCLEHPSCSGFVDCIEDLGK